MSAEDDVSGHVAAYGRQRDLYSAFAQNLDHLLRSILNGRGIQVHIIESRAKTVDSFREKINRADKLYSDPLKELPDLCGCRIITYYADDVSTISDLLISEFEIVEEVLSHQPAGLDADRFGYLSAHYVIKLNRHRQNLTEWKAFADLHAEVQIRTVIQHAWSAVSHALQYKQETAVPSLLQRRLYRIAGLFELADEEFVGIRDQRLALHKEAADHMATGQLSVALSSSTISEALKQWPNIEIIRSEARRVGFFGPGDADHDLIEARGNIVPDIYRLAERANIKSIRELISALTPPKIELFAEIWNFKNDKTEWKVSDGFLIYLLMIHRFRNFISKDYLTENGWSENIADRVIAAVDKLNS